MNVKILLLKDPSGELEDISSIALVTLHTFGDLSGEIEPLDPDEIWPVERGDTIIVKLPGVKYEFAYTGNGQLRYLRSERSVA